LNRELVVNVSPKGVSIALLENKELVEIYNEDSGKQFTVGDIYLGRVTKLVAGLNAAFVDVGYEKDAFLHYTDLGPKIRTAMKMAQAAVAGNMADPMMGNLVFEKEIVKTGKMPEGLDKRQSILVQVLKEPISTKGPRLTSEISLPGRYLILMPFGNGVGISKKVESNEERKRLQILVESIKPKNFGVVVRTVAQNKSVAEIDADLKGLLEKWKQIHQNLKGANAPQKIYGELKKTNTIMRDLLNDSFNKIVVNDAKLKTELDEYVKKIAPDKKDIVSYYNGSAPIFDHFGITKQIKSLFGKTVTMPGGPYLVIEHTEALHVIDINSGHKVGSRSDQESTALKVNMDAAKEIARQMRLRDMGGIVVLDFIDMKNPEHKRELHEYMKKEMASDRAKHTILPLSKFGLMQITRERTRPEVNIVTQEVCPSCEGTGKVEATILLVDQIEHKLFTLLEKHKHVNLIVHPYLEAYIKKGFPSLQMKWSFKYKRYINLIPVSSIHDYHLTEYHFFDENGEELGAM